MESYCFTNNTGHGHIILLQLDRRQIRVLLYTRDMVVRAASILSLHEAASWGD
jgi:hypothetical protein